MKRTTPRCGWVMALGFMGLGCSHDIQADATATEEWEADDWASDERTRDLTSSACSNSCYDTPDKEVIIGCDNRKKGPVDLLDGTPGKPWSFTGRFTGPNCSGTLIADRFVLTAAHCIDQLNGTQPLGFSLTQIGLSFGNRPFGTHTVRRIFYPDAYATNPANTEERSAYDYAVVELYNPIAGATPANWGYMPWHRLKKKKVRSVGYPGSQDGFAWSTGAQALLSSQPFKSIDNGAAGLLYTELDGEGGQSGSPVYVFTGPNRRKVVGVFIGSPEEACEDGESWVSRLNPDTVDHINNVIQPNILDFFWTRINMPYVPDQPRGEAWP